MALHTLQIASVHVLIFTCLFQMCGVMGPDFSLSQFDGNTCMVLLYSNMYLCDYYRILPSHDSCNVVLACAKFGGDLIVKKWMTTDLHFHQVCMGICPLVTVVGTAILVTSHPYLVTITHLRLGTYSFNSLWPSDTIWWHSSGSALAQVKACCLTAPSHYLNQCWFVISKVQWHSSEGNFTRDTSASHFNEQIQNY